MELFLSFVGLFLAIVSIVLGGIGIVIGVRARRSAAGTDKKIDEVLDGLAGLKNELKAGLSPHPPAIETPDARTRRTLVVALDQAFPAVPPSGIFGAGGLTIAPARLEGYGTVINPTPPAEAG